MSGSLSINPGCEDLRRRLRWAAIEKDALLDQLGRLRVERDRLVARVEKLESTLAALRARFESL